MIHVRTSYRMSTNSDRLDFCIVYRAKICNGWVSLGRDLHLDPKRIPAHSINRAFLDLARRPPKRVFFVFEFEC
jgi:hypothetical protein